MPVCSEGQRLNNERETKTTLNFFSPDWILNVRAHVEKRHDYSCRGGLTSDAIIIIYLFATNYIEKQWNMYQPLQNTVIFKTKCSKTNW